MVDGYREQKGTHSIELVPIEEEVQQSTKKVMNTYSAHNFAENFFYTITIINITLQGFLFLNRDALDKEIVILNLLLIFTVYMITFAGRKMRVQLLDQNKQIFEIINKEGNNGRK